MKIIKNGKIITENKIIEGHLLIFDKKIVDIISENDINDMSNYDVIDAKGNYVSGGFVDIHIHGINGFDTMDGTKEAQDNIRRKLCEYGVTSFLPTTMTMAKDDIINALENIKSYKSDVKGANIVGIHLEGPFINENYKGAQDEKNILLPDFEFVEKYKDIISKITYAPEKDKNLKFSKYVRENTDIKLSVGHSDANYELLGALKPDHITHLFNAMPPLHHRYPGIIGAAFNSDAMCEIICDNIHIDKSIYRIILNNIGKERLVLITDCMRAGGLSGGEFNLGGQRVIVDDTSAKLEDGTLAGSILTMDRGIYNFYNNTAADIVDVVRMATENPAKSIGIYDRKGSIAKGKDADICIFDENIGIRKTIVAGNTVYSM